MQQPVTRNPAYPAVPFPPPPTARGGSTDPGALLAPGGGGSGAGGSYYTSSQRYYGVPSSSSTSGANAGNTLSLDGKLTSPSASRSLPRGRDGAALLACLLLLRLAFSPNSGQGGHGGLVDPTAGSVTASIRLAFYAPFQSSPPPGGGGVEGGSGAEKRETARPVPLALDGAVDSLVLPVYLTRDEVRGEKAAEILAAGGGNSKRKGDRAPEVPPSDLEGWSDGGSWGLRIVSLKPPRGAEEGAAEGPFAARSAFLSPLVPHSTKHPAEGSEDTTPGRPVPKGAYPVRLLPVQIPVERTRLGEEERSRQRHGSHPGQPGSYGRSSAIPPKVDEHADYDRTRHYFCGTDWHHASGSCHRHCPGGLSSECGDGESCYADTPCDARLSPSGGGESPGDDKTKSRLALTRQGTLPGVVAVWSDGAVSLHAVTADVQPTVGSDGHRTKRAKKKKVELELRQLWRAFPFEPEAHDERHSDGGEEHPHEVEFDELGLTFESSAVFAGEGGGDEVGVGDHGAILIGGR